jgi:hypothetical protein
MVRPRTAPPWWSMCAPMGQMRYGGKNRFSKCDFSNSFLDSIVSILIHQYQNPFEFPLEIFLKSAMIDYDRFVIVYD